MGAVGGILTSCHGRGGKREQTGQEVAVEFGEIRHFRRVGNGLFVSPVTKLIRTESRPMKGFEEGIELFGGEAEKIGFGGNGRGVWHNISTVRNMNRLENCNAKSAGVRYLYVDGPNISGFVGDVQ